MIELIKANIQDIPIIYSLALKIWNHHYVPIVGQEQVDYMLGKIYSTEGLTEQMIIKKHQFYLLVLADKPVGFI